ncbi:hypothetical protein MCEMSEM23_02505 [Rhabdaerophilaceae bacterium]
MIRQALSANDDKCGVADGRPKAKRSAGRQGSRQSAIRDFIENNRPAIGRLMRASFEIRSLQEAENLATMLASHCPNPELASIGLWELLSNAIEHGNMEIDFAEKSRLLIQGEFHAEIDRRLSTPPYSGRCARVSFRQYRSHVWIRIVDQGKGFDTQAFSGEFAQIDAPNGRGIAMARQITFATLTYLGNGNAVEATILRDSW